MGLEDSTYPARQSNRNEPLVGQNDSTAAPQVLGKLDFKANPINVALPGTIGTWPGGWPSTGIRGTPATPSAVLDFAEQIKPIEQHGFILADFAADKIVLRFFTWDVKTQPVEAIDTLQPFHTAELNRPS